MAPSILSADFARLGEQVAEVMEAGARIIHVDVMDGHFVPPITIGPLIVASLREQVHAAGGVLEVHLMIERPERHVREFAEAGGDVITIHPEATPHLHYALGQIRASGGVALCMTVNPGWGGQPFIEHSLDKIRRLRALLPAEVTLEVDGGVDPDTAGPCAEAGATRFVAGSHVFGADDPKAAYRAIAAAAGAR